MFAQSTTYHKKQITLQLLFAQTSTCNKKQTTWQLFFAQTPTSHHKQFFLDPKQNSLKPILFARTSPTSKFHLQMTTAEMRFVYERLLTGVFAHL